MASPLTDQESFWYSTLARSQTFQYWLYYSVDVQKKRAPTIKEVKSLLFVDPQITSEPSGVLVLQMIGKLLTKKRATLTPYIITRFLKEELIFMQNRWFCPFCVFFTETNETLYDHINQDHSARPFLCICNQRNPTLRDAIEHSPKCRRAPEFAPLEGEWNRLVSLSIEADRMQAGFGHPADILPKTNTKIFQIF